MSFPSLNWKAQNFFLCCPSSLSTIRRQEKVMNHIPSASSHPLCLPQTNPQKVWKETAFHATLIYSKGKILQSISYHLLGGFHKGHNLKSNLAGAYQNSLQGQIVASKCCIERQAHGYNCTDRKESLHRKLPNRNLTNTCRRQKYKIA